MEIRNSRTGRHLMRTRETSTPVPRMSEIMKLVKPQQNLSGVYYSNILAEKRVVLSPPRTEFRKPSCALKKLQGGLSHTSWNTDSDVSTSARDTYYTKRTKKPLKSSFETLFPAKTHEFKQPNDFKLEEKDETPYMFNRKRDEMINFRESRLRAAKLINLR